MKRVVWLTDLHLNFVDAQAIDRFFDEVLAANPDAVLVSGDIGEAHSLVDYLADLDDRLQRPLYFVLGNHDFYFGSITEVRAQVSDLCRQRPRLTYLTDSGPNELTRDVGLVGHDGWADARVGDYERSLVMLNDYRLIRELADYNKQQRGSRLRELGDEAAAHLGRVLPAAAAAFESVFLVTHVPPLRDACWHEGQISDDEWAPHFTCQAAGDVILEVMAEHPDCHLTVLCGHTHSSGETRPLDNVVILTAGAQYGHPAIARTFELKSSGSAA